MRVVRYLLLLGFSHVWAMQEPHLITDGLQENNEKRVVPKLSGQSVIPISQDDMQAPSMKLAQAAKPAGPQPAQLSVPKPVSAQLAPVAKPVTPVPVAPPAPQPIPQAAPKPVIPVQPVPAPVAPVAPAPVPAPIAQPVQPPVPQTPQPIAQPATPQDQEDVKGIDTVDIDEPQGNWLLKRIWWQRGQAQYEKIKALVEAIMETRMAFFAKRTEWDRKIFDPFYMEVGLGRGVLEELISSLMKRIEDERTKEGQLNPEERALLDALEAEKKTLEQLQKDIQLINDIDARIDDMITMLIQQINKARSYENQSWQNLKGIAQELNDKKARELFYTMSTNWQNVNDISAFIQSQFLQSFDQLGKQAQDQIAKVKSTIQTLKEKGIDLKKQWQEIEDKSKTDKEKEKLEQEKAAQEEAAIRKKQEEEAKRGFFGKLWNQAVKVVNSVYNYIKNGVAAVWDMTIGRFFKKSPKSATAEPAQPAQQMPSGAQAPTTSGQPPISQPAPAPAIVTPAQPHSAQLHSPTPAQQSVQLS